MKLCLSNTVIVLLLLGHTAKVFRVKWCPLREGILVSGSDDKSVSVLYSIFYRHNLLLNYSSKHIYI